MAAGTNAVRVEDGIQYDHEDRQGPVSREQRKVYYD